MVAPAGKESWAWAGLPLNAYFARYVDVMEVMVMVLTEEEDALCRDLGGIDLDPCGQQLSLPVYIGQFCAYVTFVVSFALSVVKSRPKNQCVPCLNHKCFRQFPSLKARGFMKWNNAQYGMTSKSCVKYQVFVVPLDIYYVLGPRSKCSFHSYRSSFALNVILSTLHTPSARAS